MAARRGIDAPDPVLPDALPVEPFLLINRQRKHRVDSIALAGFLSRLVDCLAPEAPFTVALVGDAVIRRYNRRYRSQDKATDVLSFPMGDGYLGDVLISVDTAYNQVLRSRSLTLGRNLDRLALHGLLHLMGYDHETDRGEMKALERRLRRKFRC